MTMTSFTKQQGNKQRLAGQDLAICSLDYQGNISSYYCENSQEMHRSYNKGGQMSWNIVSQSCNVAEDCCASLADLLSWWANTTMGQFPELSSMSLLCVDVSEPRGFAEGISHRKPPVPLYRMQTVQVLEA